MGYFFEQICFKIMPRLYLSSSGIALWVNDKGKNRIIVKIFDVLNHVLCCIAVAVQLSICLFGFFHIESRTGLRRYEFYNLRLPFIDDGVVDSDSEK